MEQHADSQKLSPRNQGWTCAKVKTHHFPIFDLGEGGGLNFTLFCPRLQSSTQKKMEQQKTQHPKIKDEAAWQP